MRSKSNASASLSGTPTTRTGELLETVWLAARCQCAEPTGVSKAWRGEVPIARELYDSIDQKIELEARNGLLQFDEVIRLIEESRCKFNLTPELIKRLHRVAIQD